MRKIQLLILLFLGAMQIVLAQDRITVSGTITDASDGTILVGVSIVEKGTNNGTISDIDGRYTIEVSSNATLIFTFVGQKTQEVLVNGQSAIDVALESDLQNLDEVVVVGYQEVRKADISGAISVVDVGESFKETNANPLQSLQGRIAGVRVTTDGAPGTNATINIRGFGSFGSNNPLFIIDGVPTQFISGLNPNDIESIQVLRDAASASIYGARASNGVVLITTKKGSSDKVKVSIQTFNGVKWRRNRLDMLNAQEYGEVLFQALTNDGIAINDAIYGSGPTPTIPAFLDDAQTIPSADTDWQDEVYQAAYNQSYGISASKGGENGSFYLGLNYNHEDGLAVDTEFERISAKINTEYKVLNRITFGENLLVSNFRRVDIPELRTLESALYQHPLIPVRDNVGNFGGPVKNLGDRLNPIGQLTRNKDNDRNTWRIFGNLYTNINILKGLDLRASLGIDYSNTKFKAFNPRFVEGRFFNDNNGLFEENAFDFNTTLTTTLQYAWSNASHSITTLVGYERIHNTFEFFNTSAADFLLEGEDFQFIGAAANRTLGSDGGGNENGLKSIFGKIDYAYKDKYIVSFTIRRDGSSRFGENNRYGVFPAVSGAWKIINESFMDNVGFLEDLKLRASWGVNGNQEIGDYTFATFFGSDPNFSNYDLIGSNTNAQQGFFTTQIGNPDVKWEESEQFNIGLDMGFLQNRVYASLDYFVKNTNDLLVQPPLIDALGEGNAPFINAGDMQNKGFELVISYKSDYRKEFKYSVDFNISRYRNEVQVVRGEDEIIGGLTRISPGQPVGSFFGWFNDGIFQNQAEVDAHADQPGKGIGRLRFRDVNGDGVIDDEDRGFTGNPHPNFSFGTNFMAEYKGFDFSLFLDGVVGHDIYDDNIFLTDFFFFNSNHSAELLNAWSPENTGSSIPAVSTNDVNNEVRPSSYWLDKGTYVRIKSIVLGYTFPKAWTEKIKIARARIFIQAQNILNITAFDGFDYEVQTRSPLEIGILRQGEYPHNKSFTAGVNIDF